MEELLIDIDKLVNLKKIISWLPAQLFVRNIYEKIKVDNQYALDAPFEPNTNTITLQVINAKNPRKATPTYYDPEGCYEPDEMIISIYCCYGIKFLEIKFQSSYEVIHSQMLCIMSIIIGYILNVNYIVLYVHELLRKSEVNILTNYGFINKEQKINDLIQNKIGTFDLQCEYNMTHYLNIREKTLDETLEILKSQSSKELESLFGAIREYFKSNPLR